MGFHLPAPEVGRTVACSDLRSIPDVRLVRKPTKYSMVAADQRFTWHFRELQRSRLSASHFWHETTPGDIAEADQQHLDTGAGRCSTTLHTIKAARCNCGDTAHLSVITTFKPQGIRKWSLRWFLGEGTTIHWRWLNKFSSQHSGVFYFLLICQFWVFCKAFCKQHH